MLRNKQWSEVYTTLIYEVFNSIFKNESHFTNKIYIDPTFVGTSDGTITNPYKTLIEVPNYASSTITDTAFLWKRGTTDTIATLADIYGSNIMLGAYGTGNKPIIPDRTFNIRRSDVTIRDLDMCTIRQGSYGDVLNTIGIVVFNTRLAGGSENVFWGREIKLYGCEVTEKVRNGIFVQQRDMTISNNLEIGYCYIHKVNQAWFDNGGEQPQTYASGDAIMFNPFQGNYWYHNNIIDRSDTGNKACIIGNPGDTLGNMVTGLIENNYLYCGFSYPNGSNGVLIGGVSNSTNTSHHFAVIRNNVIWGKKYDKNGLENWTDYGIHTNTSRLHIYGNIMMDIRMPVYSGNGQHGANYCYNNTIRGKDTNRITGQHAGIFNNIFDVANFQTPTTQGNNISMATVSPNDLFIDYVGDDLRLKLGSPAIDAGAWLEWMNTEWTKDLFGTTVPQTASIDIGALQYTVEVTPTPELPPNPTYALAINTVGQGTISKNPDKVSYLTGETTQLQANAAEGFVFQGWTGDVISTANPISLTFDANKVVTATFVTITQGIPTNPIENERYPQTGSPYWTYKNGTWKKTYIAEILEIYHNSTLGRNEFDAHEIDAITGLREELDILKGKALITTLQLTQDSFIVNTRTLLSTDKSKVIEITATTGNTLNLANVWINNDMSLIKLLTNNPLTLTSALTIVPPQGFTNEIDGSLILTGLNLSFGLKYFNGVWQII